MLSSLDKAPQNTRCERGQPWQWLSLSSGQLYPDECQTWKCPACGPRRAQRYARAFDAARYERWVTLTLVPEQAAAAVNRLAYRIRKAGVPWEWAWVVERGDETGMRHVHAVVRGDFVDKEWLDAQAKHAGISGFSWITLAATDKASYASKSCYAAKNAAGSWDEYLALQGGARGWHVSRKYCRGQPIREFVAEHARGTDDGPFVMYGAGVPFNRLPKLELRRSSSLDERRHDAGHARRPEAWRDLPVAAMRFWEESSVRDS